jgi:DNA-binding SARP family transcriptional activator
MKGQRLAADGELAPASATLGEALGLRRGEPLAEFTYAGFFDAERTRLNELTLVATESRAGADLGLGHYGELAGELETRCREHPLRERLWELLILALYRSGRQAEALRAYTESVIVWSTSWASTPARPCGISRPASWPRTRRSAHPARRRLSWSPRRKQRRDRSGRAAVQA